MFVLAWLKIFRTKFFKQSNFLNFYQCHSFTNTETHMMRDYMRVLYSTHKMLNIAKDGKKSFKLATVCWGKWVQGRPP